MTPEEVRAKARQLAEYAEKTTAKSVTFWLDTMELRGADRVDPTLTCHSAGFA